MHEGYTLTFHDPKLFTDDEIAEGVAFGNILTKEVLPDEPDTPVEQALATHREMPPRIRRWSFRVRDSAGTLVASGGTRIDPEHDDNPDVLGLGINVLPEHRQQGIGTQLLAELVNVARSEGRTRLLTDTSEKVPAGEAFARSVGAEPRMAAHLNHLPIAEVDRQMLERWVAEAAERSADYELISFDGSVPDELLEDFVDLYLVMNTAPRDELDVNDFTLTPDEFREHERIAQAAGHVTWTVIARHKDTGEMAGFHDVTWNASSPQSVWVGATGVRPAHRGHALGKWLKAVVTLRVMDERPEVTDIRTGNADSNDAMLGINKLMGYRPMLAQTVWNLPVDVAEKWLADRGVTATTSPTV